MDLPLEGGMAMEKEGFQDKGLQQWPDPQIHWCEALLCDTEGQGRHSRSFASTQKHPKTESPETLKFNKTEASTIIYKKNPEKKKNPDGTQVRKEYWKKRLMTKLWAPVSCQRVLRSILMSNTKLTYFYLRILEWDISW